MEQGKVFRFRLRHRKEVPFVSALFGVAVLRRAENRCFIAAFVSALFGVVPEHASIVILKLKTFPIYRKSFQFDIDFKSVLCYTDAKGVLYGFDKTRRLHSMAQPL